MIAFRGILFVTSAVFAFLLARLTQVGWLYLFDAMLWGAVLVSVVLPWLAVPSLSVRRRVLRGVASGPAPSPSEGETVQVEVALNNGRAWPRYLLTLKYHCPLADPEHSETELYVPRLDTGPPALLTSAAECHRRGMFHFGPVTVESSAPFGLFRRRRRLQSPLSVLVYPRVYPLDRAPLLEGAEGTAVRPRRTPAGLEVAGSRHYAPGDPIRTIHWRNTARLSRPMVKVLEESQEDSVAIVFDSTQDRGTGRDTELEYSVKLAASVAGFAARTGKRVRVLTGGLPPQETEWTSLLRGLALLEPGCGPGLSGLLDSVPAGAKVLALVSDKDLGGIDSLARRSRGMGGMAVIVYHGFGYGPDDLGQSSLEALRKTGVPVLGCTPGGLEECLAILQSTRPDSGLNPVASGARSTRAIGMGALRSQ